MPRLIFLPILFILLNAALNACGSSFPESDKSFRKYVVFKARIVGTPVKSSQKFLTRYANISLTQCENSEENGLRRISLMSGREILEFKGSLEGCRFELLDFEMDSFGVVEKFTLLQGQAAINLIKDSRQRYASESGVVEVLIERGFEDSTSDVNEVRIQLKPIFAARSKYSGAEHIDLTPPEGAGFMFISKVKFLTGNEKKRYKLYLFEFSCPEQMREMFCLRDNILDQRLILLKENELKFSKEELVSIAAQQNRYVLPNRLNIVDSTLSFRLPVEDSRQSAPFGILVVSGLRVRMHKIKLPEPN